VNFLLRSSHSFKREGNDSESKFDWKDILNKNFPKISMFFKKFSFFLEKILRISSFCF
jgi:hypothetical protein